MKVKMFPMDFGESILLCDDKSCLLVDCGSESSKRKGYFNTVKDKLAQFNKKSLLITHFHSDHINGIQFLGRKFLEDFENVYLPHIFAFEDKTLELLIAEYLLEALLDRRRKSAQIWGCLIPVAKSHSQIVLVGKGTQFEEASQNFQALWPVPRNLETEKDWSNVKNTYQYLQLPYGKIEKLALDTKEVILWITGYNDLQSKHTDAEKELQDILEEYRNLRDNYVASMQGSGGIVAIHKECIWESYRDIKNKNETSIVFQTTDGDKQVLMTGDITPKILEDIAKSDSVALPNQKKHYDVIKAPHHGTESCYFDFSQYYKFDKLYISNGETTWPEQSRGKICSKYFSDTRTYTIVCHNTERDRCEFAYDKGEHAACCTRCKISNW